MFKTEKQVELHNRFVSENSVTSHKHYCKLLQSWFVLASQKSATRKSKNIFLFHYIKLCKHRFRHLANFIDFNISTIAWIMSFGQGVECWNWCRISKDFCCCAFLMLLWNVFWAPSRYRKGWVISVKILQSNLSFFLIQQKTKI